MVCVRDKGQGMKVYLVRCGDGWECVVCGYDSAEEAIQVTRKNTLGPWPLDEYIAEEVTSPTLIFHEVFEPEDE
jgi:hypothetical protein